MRFFSKTKLADVPRPGMTTPCLEWQACCTRDGYGQLFRAGKSVLAHRMAWELEHGPVPDGLCVLHRCDNPPCVASGHLFLGTQLDNIGDMIAKGRDRKATGDANGSRLHPESRPRGEDSGSRLHPECLARGGRNGNAKLTEHNVRRIFQLRAQGWSQKRLGAELGVSDVQIGRILARKLWTHVDLENLGKGMQPTSCGSGSEVPLCE